MINVHKRDALTAIDMIANENNKSDLIDFNSTKIDVNQYHKSKQNKVVKAPEESDQVDFMGELDSKGAHQINGISMEDLGGPQNQKNSGISSPLSVSNLSSSSACVTDPLSISNLSAGMSGSFNSSTRQLLQ